MRQNVKIYDTTLRDGAQSCGVSFSVEDKLLIAKVLDEFGVYYIEAGYPSSNPKDIELFQKLREIKFKNSKIVAFGSTRKPNINANEDNTLKALICSNTEYVTIYGKSWDFHVKEIIKTTLEENLNMIKDSVEYLVLNGKKVIFDAEHFFDGYINNAEYALKTIKTAIEAGAYSICLCDTNGGILPDKIYEITKRIKAFVGDDIELGIHCHNDGGLSVANSINAIFAGASQVQGTFNGIGERCGNTNLSTIIATLELKLNVSCLSNKSNIKRLKEISDIIADISNITLDYKMPYVGKNAFAHKGGAHVDGINKDPNSFEHINPLEVGNSRKNIISEQSGRSAIIECINKIEPNIEKNDIRVSKILNKLKLLEYEGYQFESSEASFELIIAKELGKYISPFELEELRVTINTPFDETSSVTAIVKLKVGDERQLTVGEGVGPVNALDDALRKALNKFYPELKKVRLIDYKVRVLDAKDGTEKPVRVSIRTTDGKHTWDTIGVSRNIIEASWKALIDSIEYKLFT